MLVIQLVILLGYPKRKFVVHAWGYPCSHSVNICSLYNYTGVKGVQVYLNMSNGLMMPGNVLLL